MAEQYTVSIDLKIIDEAEMELIIEKYKGETGATPVLTIGTVTDVPYGTPSSATITGTPEAPVLNLYLQHGASGNETIDDTAGIGDDDLVWSADKTKKELNTKADIIGIVDDTAEAVKTIPDGADGIPMALTVGIDPVQDLHGYDNPWPAGGGKNLIDKSLFTDGYGLSTDGVPVEFTDRICTLTPIMVSGTSLIISYRNLVSSESDIGVIYSVLNGETKMRREAVKNQDVVINISDGDRVYICLYKTVAGSNYSQHISLDDFDNLQLEYGSQKTDFAPYSNICPISGWTGCNVTRTGKNLCDNVFTNGMIDDYGDVDGANASHKTSGFIPAKSNTTYVLSGTNLHVRSESDTNPAAIRYAFYDKDKKFLSRSNADSSSQTVSMTTTSSTAFIRFFCGKGASDVQLEEGSVATAYEAYAGEEYSITFPSSAGTVYGGTLTVNKDGTGTLVVDRIKITIDGTNKSVVLQKESGTVCSSFRCGLSASEHGSNDGDLIPLFISNMLARASTDRVSNGKQTYSYNVNVDKIYITLSETIHTAVDANAYLSENNVEIAYYLATPVTYQLTALEVIETLKGINNIFADTGDILSVDYSADTKMYVDAGDESTQEQIDLTRGMIAESDNAVATENHAIGELFICGNNLYKAIDTISVGETLAVGENVELTTIVDNLISQSIAEYYYSWVIGSARGSGSYYVFKSGRLRTLSASLNPVCFTSDFLDAEDRPTQDTTNFLANYAYYSNNQRISELCLLRYTKASNVWELVKGDGTVLALGDDVADKASTQSITFNAIWYV